MKPLSSFPDSDRRAIRVLLADIDDTMTRAGKLPAASYRAMWDLHDVGVAVIPVTGRPAGWCDLICRQWPVAGVVGENGAFVFHMDGDHLRSIRHPAAPDPEANRARLAAIAAEIYERIPGTRPAKDQFARLYDVAVDFREEPPLLDFAVAERIKEIFEGHGARAKVSSIHVNAWFGDYDKLSMARLFLADRLGLDIDDPVQNAQAIFCGDSPNDEPMFAAFRNSVGVANIAAFAPSLDHTPTYVCELESADGFVELAEAVYEAVRPVR
ncbi:MAG: HAD-IIB family hydrolase [Spirochaetota bacterium]